MRDESKEFDLYKIFTSEPKPIHFAKRQLELIKLVCPEITEKELSEIGNRILKELY